MTPHQGAGPGREREALLPPSSARSWENRSSFQMLGTASLRPSGNC